MTGVQTCALPILFTSFVAAIVIAFFQSPEIIWSGALANGLWIYGLILGLFGIVIPIYLFSIAVPQVGAATSSILSAAELPVAVTVSVLLLNEKLTFLQVMGILIILIGMTLPTMMQKKTPDLTITTYQ